MSKTSRLAEEMRLGFARFELLHETHEARLEKLEAIIAVQHLEIMSKLNILIDAVAGIRTDLDIHMSDGHGGEL